MYYAIIHTTKEEIVKVSRDLITGIQSQLPGSQGQCLKLTDSRQSDEVLKKLEGSGFVFIIVLLDKEMIKVLEHRRSAQLFQRISDLVHCNPREKCCILFVKYQINDEDLDEFKSDIQGEPHLIEFTSFDEVARYTSKCMIDREATESEDKDVPQRGYAPWNQLNLQSMHQVNTAAMADPFQRIPQTVLDLQNLTLQEPVENSLHSIRSVQGSSSRSSISRTVNGNEQHQSNQIVDRMIQQVGTQYSPNIQIVDPSLQPMRFQYPANDCNQTNQGINFPYPANSVDNYLSQTGLDLTSFDRDNSDVLKGNASTRQSNINQRQHQQILNNSGNLSSTEQCDSGLTKSSHNSSEPRNPANTIQGPAYLPQNHILRTKNEGKSPRDSNSRDCANPNSHLTNEGSFLSSYIRAENGPYTPFRGICLNCMEIGSCLSIRAPLPSFQSNGNASFPTFCSASSLSGPDAMPCLSGYGYCFKCLTEPERLRSQQLDTNASNRNYTGISDLSNMFTSSEQQSIFNSLKKNGGQNQTIANNPTSNGGQNQTITNNPTSNGGQNQTIASNPRSNGDQNQRVANNSTLHLSFPQFDPLLLAQHTNSDTARPRSVPMYGQHPCVPLSQSGQMPRGSSGQTSGQNVGARGPTSQNSGTLNDFNRSQTELMYTRMMQYNISGPGSFHNSGESETDNTKAPVSTKHTQTDQQERLLSSECGPSGEASFISQSTGSDGASSSIDSGSGGATGMDDPDDRSVWDLSKPVLSYVRDTLDLASCHNWTDIADQHGWSYGRIHQLSKKWEKRLIESPFLELIADFEPYTIRNLKDDLRKISRKDVLQKLQRFEINNELFSGRFQ